MLRPGPLSLTAPQPRPSVEDMRASWVIALLLAALVLAGTAAARDPKDPQQRHTAADTELANRWRCT